MTTETDLLPLPDWMECLGEVSAADIRDYARANVAHATAPLQAEIEALRAEVDEWKDVAKCASEQQDSLFNEARALNELADNLRAEVYFRDSVIATHAADTREYQKRISQAEARAERLAEALQELKDLMLGQVKWEPCDCGCPQQRTPDGPHSATWLRAVQQVEIAISKAEGKE